MTQVDGEFEYWKMPAGSTVREKPPARVEDDSIKNLNETIARGAGETVYAIIGLDFGTSSTKVIVRFPYEAGQPTYAIPMPDFCLSEGNPHLWQTVVWLDENSRFHPHPVSGAMSLHTLKQDLMTDAENTEDIRIASTSAATAYLAFVLRYIRGRVLKDCPQIFSGRTPLWFLNVGMATKGYDDEKLKNAYRRVAAAALILSSSNLEISVASVLSALNHNTVTTAAGSFEAAEKMGVAVFPETTAQAVGFIKNSVGAEGGVFAMIDVGAMTLDVCTGMIHGRGPFEDKFPLYFADVQHLGVEAYYWYMQEYRNEVEFRRQCREEIWHAIAVTRSKKNRLAMCWERGNDLPVYLMGGGAKNNLHSDIVRSLSSRLSEWTKNGGFRILSPEPPRTIDSAEPIKDFGRLAVAWGLSYPPMEIPDSIPPAEIEDEVRRPPSDWSGRFPRKEDM